MSTPTFNQNAYQSYFHTYQEVFASIVVLGALYSLLAILSILSCYALLKRRRGNGKLQPTSIVLCLTILTLFTSTTIYAVASIIVYHIGLMNDLVNSAATIWSDSAGTFNREIGSVPYFLMELTSRDVGMHACASAGTLTVNVVLGDAIVCWRACVIWHKNLAVKVVYGVLLVAIFVLGVIDTFQSCRPPLLPEGINLGGGTPLSIPGSLFEGIPIGLATSMLSLGTNVFATLLVAYKAWQSRKGFKGYLVAKVGGSQVQKLLALPVESGAFYSVIWSVVVAFQAVQYCKTSFDLDPTNHFIEYFGVFMNSALVPTIAIYPAIIIVLVALNRSQAERGFPQRLESFPTPHLATPVSTIGIRSHDTLSQGSSDIQIVPR